MELRTINPRHLKFNPNNPRRTKVAPEQDAQLVANIQAQGVLQPPIVREDGDKLVVIAGESRVRCSIKAKLTEIHVLVRNSDDGGDAMRALAETSCAPRCARSTSGATSRPCSGVTRAGPSKASPTP